MKQITKICSTLFIFTILSGCAPSFNDHKALSNNMEKGDDVRALNTLGHYSEATLDEHIQSAMIINIIKGKMGKYDREELNHVYERGIPNQSSCWLNPDTGNQFIVVPQLVYPSRSGRICRKAEIIAERNGEKESVYATACKDKEGSWKIL